MKSFLRNNGLSITFLLLFIGAMIGQVVFGFKEHNDEMLDEGGRLLTLGEYLTSGHFIQATFENWESEFLQMALFVWLTIYLRQKGSSESKHLDRKEDVDRKPSAKKKDAPWAVRQGGWILKLYSNSLTIALVVMFVISFVLHFYGSLNDENLSSTLKGKPLQTASDYLASPRFWFESFQNWQSEFLSVFAIITMSIYLRQKGSPQSKPVDASHDETGE
ncbi:MAG TPA: DUF6766 family protein [Flavobacterium sp.]|jgi:hypothetical protein